MKARLGWLVAIAGAGAVALSATAQGSPKLAVGPDAGGYLCPDGRQLYVKSCYDELPDAGCGVVNMHLPSHNGFQRVTTEIRSQLTSSVAGCKIYPLEFRDGVVSLVLPKSAPPQETAKAPASTAGKTTVVVPGTDGKPLALARLPDRASKAITFYIDESSRRPLAQTGSFGIWTLWVYHDGLEQYPGTTAAWINYAVNCAANSFEMDGMIRLDRQAKLLGGSKMEVKGPVTKDSVTDIVAHVACQRGGSLKGPRLTTTLAAINDAMPAATSKH